MALNGLPELSSELSRLVEEIAGDEDCSLDAIDEAVSVLRKLRGLVSGQDEKPPSAESDEAGVPVEFLCPISKRLMQEPVVLETGQTYDRPHIEELLSKGDPRCPKTQKHLSYAAVTPNNLIRDLISQWCREQKIELPKAMQHPPDNAIIEPSREYFQLLLDRFSTTSSLEDLKAAAKELRQLTERVPSFRAFFTGSSCAAIAALLNAATQPELQEDLVATVLNISVHKDNQKLMVEDAYVISRLIELMNMGSLRSRTNAAAALFTLLAQDSSKRRIAGTAALGPLVFLLKEAEPLALNDITAAISSLCSITENKERAIREGVVGIILGRIRNTRPSDELISLLASFSTNQDAVDQMSELGAVSCMLGVLKEITNERSKEHCVAILYSIASRDSAKMREIRRDEKANGTLSAVARSQTSTPRAKRKANSILDKIAKTYLEMHTS